MKIMNIDGLTFVDIQQQIDEGSRFIYFPYTISMIFGTFKGASGVYLVRPGENKSSRYLYTLLSLVFGWWGIPSGPKQTVKAIATNLRGGKNVTGEVMAVLAGDELFKEVNAKRPLN